MQCNFFFSFLVSECWCMCMPLFQTLVNLCSRSPCKNKGTCIQEKAQSRCLCPSGWAGAYCDVPNVSCEVAASHRGELCPLRLKGPFTKYWLTSSVLGQILLSWEEREGKTGVDGEDSGERVWNRRWKGRGTALEIPKRKVFEVKGRHIPLSGLVYF